MVTFVVIKTYQLQTGDGIALVLKRTKYRQAMASPFPLFSCLCPIVNFSQIEIFSQNRVGIKNVGPWRTTLKSLTLIAENTMVISSHAALNKVGSGSMRELNEYITCQLSCPGKLPSMVKPVGLHFIIHEKIFKGTNQPYISCPIQFLLRDGTGETELGQPVWAEQSNRGKVNRKAKIGVKKHSVIRLDDFSVVVHPKGAGGYLLFIRSYHVVRKDVDQDAFDRWQME